MSDTGMKRPSLGNAIGRAAVLGLLVGFWLLHAFPLRARAGEDETGSSSPTIEERVDILTEELVRLREQLAIPETDAELRSQYGLGPAASKVYALNQGISMGGYGEFYFAAPIEDTELTGARNKADFYRFITYFGYKFSDKIVMNTEIEFEHATTGANYEDESGEVSVEFSYLDFLLHESANVRVGNVLVPVGFINEMHEPPFYRGNFRPNIEQRIIPSTWRELGAGLHGTLGEGVRYTTYVLNGLNGAEFSEKGVRDGRQKGNRALWEDLAAVLSVAYDHQGSFSLGGSFYTGGADHDGIFDPGADPDSSDDDTPVSVSNQIIEAHAQLRYRGLEARALFAKGSIDGAAELSPLIYPDGDKQVPEGQIGWYVEAAYDVAPLLLGEDTTVRLSPWVRYEDYDLQDEVAAVGGLAADATHAVQSLTLGVELLPHPSVVLKADFVHTQNDADAATSDEIRLGAGFVY